MNVSEALYNCIPPYVSALMHRLRDAGYEAFAVGGCVRDILLAKEPSDWDLCSSATPEQLLSVFRDERVVTAGVKHGTVGVVCSEGIVEITTYRIDSDYSDGRHPGSVSYTSSLDEDLCRRDFTINAMALDVDCRLHDPQNGMADIERGVISCIGSPEERFYEDALRIMRALRFSSVLGFDIDEKTSEAILKLRSRLSLISAERKRDELVKLVCGAVPLSLCRYREVFEEVVPGAAFCADDSSFSATLSAISSLECDKTLRLTALFTRDASRETLTALRFDNKTIKDVLDISAAFGSPFPFSDRDIGLALMDIKRTDAPEIILRAAEIRAAYGMLDPCELARLRLNVCRVAEDESRCFHISRLNITGDDIKALGVKGKAVGEMLQALLRKTAAAEVKNEREALLREVEKLAR